MDEKEKSGLVTRLDSLHPAVWSPVEYDALQREFCPPIDSSLFSAIALDHDFNDRSSYSELRKTLDILKESAAAQDFADFDASGSSGLQPDAQSSGDSSDLAQSWHGEVTSSSEHTEDTDSTGISQNFEAMTLGYGQDRDLEATQHEKELEALPVKVKVSVLKEMFPEAKDFDINYTLKKAHNNFGKVVEELLNQAFLAQECANGGEPLVKRGVEGFSETSTRPRGRKNKGKRKQILRRTSSNPGPSADKIASSPSPLSRWDRAKEDVDFIAQRTYISPQVIASAYHKSGGSLASTIAALCASNEPDANPYIAATPVDVLEKHAAELALEFALVSHAQTAAIVRLTHPSTASAQEIARVLVSTRSLSAASRLIPQYSPRPRSPTSDTTSTSSNSGLAPLHSDTVANLNTSRSAAFTQAQSAYRKSRSNHLMGGAAAYYSAVGRDAAASLRRHDVIAADELVATQSRPGIVDLHGVNVRDAVRIAKAKVELWWDCGARESARAGKAMAGGLTLITGQGRHSEGGKGKLGPAVAGMLVKEGWKIEVGQGNIDVVGRARR